MRGLHRVAHDSLERGRDMQATGVWSLQPLADMSAAEFRDWRALPGPYRRRGQRAAPGFPADQPGARMRELGIADYASYYRQVTDGPRGAVDGRPC
jgi:type IV pilus assembly protein PilK